MQISAAKRAKEFVRKHPTSRAVINAWLQTVRDVSWQTPGDITQTFRRTDCVKGKWLFNIGGNKYRLAAKVWFGEQKVRILKVMTHEEYDEEDWRKTPKRSAVTKSLRNSVSDGDEIKVRNLSMRKVGKKYKQLIDRFALQPIENDNDLEIVDEIADELYERLESIDPDEEIYLKVLTLLIEQYEAKAHPLLDDPISPLEMLKFLMAENGLKQVDLTKILGISSGNASEIIGGKRELTKSQIGVLAHYFKVNASLFLPSSSPWGDVHNSEIKPQIVAEEPHSLAKPKAKKGK
jgi:mRNA interferase HigB